jgi:hypothetical protein
MLARSRLPPFRLETERDETERAEAAAAWWQRREIIVALVHARCSECTLLRSRLASRGPLLRARGAAHAVLEMDGPGVGPELASQVARSLDVRQGVALVVVADRYGEPFAALPVHGSQADVVLDEAEAWIDHIQQQCPE